jgi:hypothetical protein
MGMLPESSSMSWPLPSSVSVTNYEKETIQYLWLQLISCDCQLHHIRLLVDDIWQGNPWISLLIWLHWWFFCVLASRTRPSEENTCWLSGLGVYQKLTFTNLYLSSTSHSRYHHHIPYFPHLCTRPELFASEWEVSVSQRSSLTTTMTSTVENFILHSYELLHPRILPWMPFCPLSLLPSITWMRQH